MIINRLFLGRRIVLLVAGSPLAKSTRTTQKELLIESSYGEDNYADISRNLRPG